MGAKIIIGYARHLSSSRCTSAKACAAIAACVDLAQGAVNASGQRLLSLPKGNAAMGQAPMLQRTGDGPMTATAYVRLYVQREGDVPGTYTANLPITLRYGVVNGGFANCNALGSNAAGPAAFGSGSTAAIPTPARKR